MSTIDVGAAPQSLADLAYDGLRARLVTLEIAPGSPINDETLAAALGVGRTPVREALKRLEQDRLVVTYPRRGTFATRVEITDLAYLSEIRAELEPLAARRAARNATPETADALRAALRLVCRGRRSIASTGDAGDQRPQRGAVAR